MRKDLDEMRHETRQGFATANQKFELMNNNMTVITSTLSTLHTQLQNTMHAMLGQKEEKMLSDKAHAIDMWIIDLKRMLNKAQTNEDKISISAKIKHLEETREHLRCEYENIGYDIMNMLTGPICTALPAPRVPPGLPTPSMPPPSLPNPSTPTHHNNIVPPTPAPTSIINSGKHAEPLTEEQSLTKRITVTNIATRSSPRNAGPRPAHTMSESSGESTSTQNAAKRQKKDRELSVRTGSDVVAVLPLVSATSDSVVIYHR
jgi:hypothetical protein